MLNNGGWKSPRLSVLALRSSGDADECDTSFEPAPDYSGIASAAGNAFGLKISKVFEIDAGLDSAFNAVRSGRAAVLDVLSAQ